MISDEAIYKAAQEYEQAYLASLPDDGACEHLFSPKFQRKMRPLLRKPAAGLRVLAACLLLVATLGVSLLFVSGPQVQASDLGWISYAQRSGSFLYTFRGVPSDSETVYSLGWVPDGYRFFGRYKSAHSTSAIYLGPDGYSLTFKSYFSAFDGVIDIGRDIEPVPVTVLGQPASLYPAATDEGSTLLVWANPDNNVLFMLKGWCSTPELLQMAEQVVEGEATQSGEDGTIPFDFDLGDGTSMVITSGSVSTSFFSGSGD